MVAVVATPKAHPLAQEIGLLVVVLGRADDINGVDPAGLAQVKHLRADFAQCRVPGNALVLAAHQLHRITKAKLAMAMLAQCSAFGAMRTQVDRRVKHWFLTHPDPVLNHRVNRAPHRAMGAYRTPDFYFSRAAIGTKCCGIRFFNERELCGGKASSDAQTRAAQKSAPVHGWQCTGKAT